MVMVANNAFDKTQWPLNWFITQALTIGESTQSIF
jgi:hypothetical protein